ncbi:MAG: hypothetical protein IK061_11030 [Desulfovibrio sp.]|nr:hypothetical protein [Desulfovibrio sp.]
MKAYYASLLPLDDGDGLPGDWYLISFIDFPRAVTQARSLAECIAMGQDILEIEGRNFVENGRPLPEPSSYEAALLFTQEAMQEEGMDRARHPLVQIFALPEIDLASVDVQIRMSRWDLRCIEARAKTLGLGRDEFLVRAARACRDAADEVF